MTWLVRFLIVAPVGIQLAQAQSTGQKAPATGQQAAVSAVRLCGEPEATYSQLTSPWREATPQKINLGTAPIELTIQAKEFSDQPIPLGTNAAAPDALCFWSVLSVGVNISTAGEGYAFANGEGSARGGGGGKLPADDFARLELLMDNLPDDGGRVPPPERRVFVILQKNGSTAVRLYDNGNLPDAVIEMIRLTGARIKIQTPTLQPDRSFSPQEADSLPRPASPRRGTLSVSKDGSLGVLHDFVTKTLTVYEGSKWPDYGLPQGGNVIRTIPEFWQPNVYGGYAVGTEFSPDGRYLLVGWGNRIGVLLYDTNTWQPVTDPNIFPQRLKEYLHAPDWALGVAVNEAGETMVWDWAAHRVVSKLPGLGEFEDPPVIRDRQGNRIYNIPNAEIEFATFSPDRTRVAIYSGPDNRFKLHVSVWDVESGRNLRNFQPMESILSPRDEPLWWNDGRWLVASQGNGKGVWDMATGRFLGSFDLTGCDARETVAVDEEELRQRCFAGNDKKGQVLQWSVAGFQKGMFAFASQIASSER